MEWIVIFVFVTVYFHQANLSDVPENITSYPCTDQNHIFLVPGVLTAGGSSRACVSRFHHAGPVRMVVTLRAEGQPAVTAVREMSGGDGGCIDIAVPLLPNSKAEMAVNMRYPEAHCAWERRLEIRIGGARVVVAHTERARYRPGETMRARIFILKADLTPAHGPIEEIWLEGPRGSWEGARAAEWRRVRTRLGVAQIQHELDEQAPAGRWTLRVRLADGSQGSAAFHLGDYELPPFQLSVRHAPRVLSTSERLVWTVCVRYPWTEAVEGMLVIRIRGAGGTTANSNGIRTAVRLRAPRACHRHAAAARRIGLNGANPPDVVVADFSFQEESTRIWQNTTVVSQVVDKPVALEFITKHRAIISPWLPYKLKVKATRWDNKPARNELVKVCRTPATSTDMSQAEPKDRGVCNEATVDSDGVARILFLTEDDGSSFYRFSATIKNDSSISAAPLYLPLQRQGSVHAVLGPLKSVGQDVRTYVPLYLSLKKVTIALTVHFVVITRGGIIYRWGATTQCPMVNSAEQVQTASRNSICYNDTPSYKLEDQNFNIGSNFSETKRSNIVQIRNGSNDESKSFTQESSESRHNLKEFNAEPNESDALYEKPMLRVMLPVKVSHQMCPDSHLIAYFYYKGELVSASKHFEMEECFENKVEATFESRQAAPGSITSLKLKTSGPALCALTAVNSASKWVQPEASVKDVLLSGLKRLVEGHRNLTEYDAAGDCFLKSDTFTVPPTSLALAASWLAGAGVRLVGGDRSMTGCFTAPAPLLAEDVTVPRSDFSEAWLWRLVQVSANGTGIVEAKAPDSITRHEASAVCVTRTGVDLSQPAVLQVFREFFIHADSPRRLRRGDTCIIRYRLFNYLYEPISVQIKVLTDPHLEGPNHFEETACIGARTFVARRIEVTASLPGKARVSIRAKAIVDGSCSNSTRNGVSDEVIVQITVDPEGILVEEQKSILLCGKDSKESSTSEVSWSWPEVQAVPGTESLTLWAVGDVVGPLFADADDLVTLPRGCGEQNLARMATSLLALQQLDPTSEAYAIAKEHVARGFTRQLQYVHPLGGFSAFGATDPNPSTWLTAFAMRYLKKAFQLLSPGSPSPPVLSRAESWLLSQQMENGCFRNEGQVFHRELRGGLNEEGEIASVALTAYVITSLMESSILSAGIIRNALSCLRALPPPKSKSPARIYAHSLLAYAFLRLRKYENEVQRVNEASVWDKETSGHRGVEGMVGLDGAGYRAVLGLQGREEVRQLVELLALATRGGDFVWWDTGSLATSIEATGYALLALAASPANLREVSFAHDARAAIRWLSTHRSAAGGFVATQDTLIALEALTAWSSTQPYTPTRLAVTARSGALTRTANLTPGVKVPIHIMMGMGYSLTVGVEGTGCALIQATRHHNTLTVDHKALNEKELTVHVTVHTDGAFNCEANQTSCYCAAIVETCVLWTGIFPEMALLEVGLPGGYGTDAALLYSQLHQGSTLLRRIELSTSRITYYLGDGSGGGAGARRGGHQCWRAHVVGPRARTQPAHVIVKSYYAPEVNDSQMYSIPEDCPAKIEHKSKQYLPSQNLYVKSLSFSKNGGILISDNFTSNDIPAGMPLEDPMYDDYAIPFHEPPYDNLTKDQVTEEVHVDIEVIKTDRSNSPAFNKVIQATEEPYHHHSTKLNDSFEEITHEEEKVTHKDEISDNITPKIELEMNSDHNIIPSTESNEASSTLTYKEIENNTITEESKKYKVLLDYNIKTIDNDLVLKNQQENSGYDEKLRLPEEKIDRMLGFKKVSDGTPSQRPKETRRVKFFTDEEIVTGNGESFDPKPLEVQLNSESITRENDLPKTVERVNMDKGTKDATNQGPPLTRDTENRKQEMIRDVLTVANPHLSEFHVIDSSSDLEVPTGIEGPIPAIVLPPPDMPRNYVKQSYRSPLFGEQSNQKSNYQSQLVPSKHYPHNKLFQNDQPYEQSSQFIQQSNIHSHKHHFENDQIYQMEQSENQQPSYLPPVFRSESFNTDMISGEYIGR